MNPLSGESLVQSEIPEINKDLLVDYAGWEVLKEGTAIAKRGAVNDFSWEANRLKGEVVIGERKLYPVIEWRKGRLQDFSCQCPSARRGIFCGHLTGLLYAAGILHKEQVSESGTEEIGKTDTTDRASQTATSSALPALPPPLRGIRVSEQKGIPIRLHVRIAPNWEATLVKDQVMVMLEVEFADGRKQILDQLDRGKAYLIGKGTDWILRWVEQWCQGKFFGMLHLSRERIKCWMGMQYAEWDVAWSFADGRPITAQDPIWAKLGGEREVESPANLSSTQSKTHSTAVDNSPTNGSREAVSELRGNRAKNSNRVAGKRVKATLEGSRSYLSIRFEPGTDEWREWANLEGLNWEPSNQRFWLRNPRQVVPFLARNWDKLRQEVQLTEAPHFKKVFGECRIAVVRAAVEIVGGEQQIRFEAVDEQGEPIPYEIDWNLGTLKIGEEEELRWILDDQSVQRARKLLEALRVDAGRTILVKAREEAFWSREFSREGITLQAPQDWKQRTEALLNFSQLQQAQLPEQLDSQLRIYQKIGVAWMVHLFRQGLSGILADDMGLGKTVQTIALIEACRRDNELPGMPWLVVCPASLVENWIREVKRFAPSIVIGDLRSKSPSVETKTPVDLWIGSYHRVARQIEELQQITFGAVIADEAQHVKNPDTRNAEALKLLQAERRLMLTGTPLENRMEDLVSLFGFLMPGYLKVPGKDYSLDARKAWLAQVPARVAPYILRRTRSQVLQELPERVDQTLFADMTSRQRQLYDRLEAQAGSEIKAWLEGEAQGKQRMKVLALLTRLRQASVEPRTLEAEWSQQDSAKAVMFEEIVETALDSGSRLLVFSQFVSVLEIWRQDLAKKGITSCFLHGGVKNEDRMKEVDRFQNDPQIPVFFLSLKVGGVGLNLTGADKVIVVDPWWNPAVEEQAVARAHRMGQTRSVHSLKMIASGTVEERVLALQQEKQQLLESLWETSAEHIESRTLLERVSELF